MPNILEYLEWRGDLRLNQSEFNEIDNLILARFSYLPFDHVLKPGEVITIKEANERFQKLKPEEERILQKEDLDLFPALAKTNRFCDMQIAEYINKVNPEEEKQFSAITILMPDDTIYISYRGTDNTIIGWKEDFNMSFRSKVPSQLDAVAYLEEIARKYDGLIRVGGHSKGGNIAVYAASFCPKKIQERIIQIYNNDGPGFDEEIIQDPFYQAIVPKISTFVPQTSIIGRLLYHEEKYTVVKSTQVGLMQHDVYTWQLQADHFIHLDEVDNGSQFIDKTIKQWLTTVTPKQRGDFINIIFQIVDTVGVETLDELKTKWLKNAKTILLTYRSIDDESKKIISQTIEALFVIMKSNLLDKFPKLPERKKKKEIE